MITANRQSIENQWWRRFTHAAPLSCHRHRQLPPWRFVWRKVRLNGVSSVIAEVEAMGLGPMATTRLIGCQEATVTSQLPLAGLLRDQGPDQSGGDPWKPRGGWDGAAYGCGVSEAFLAQCLGLAESPNCPTAVPAPETMASNPMPHAVRQVRGVLAERVIVSTLLDLYLPLKALAAYSGIGLRKLYEFLTDPIHPLPHYRIGGKILVRRSEFDAWITHYRRCGQADVDSIVEGVMRGLG